MKRLLGTSILIGVLSISGFGQVNARRENQQDRVAQGVRSGQLTPGETANLENQERAVNGEIRADKKANGGKLTGAERAQIKRQQNGLSKQIYTDKHNAASDHFGKSEVGRPKKISRTALRRVFNRAVSTPGRPLIWRTGKPASRTKFMPTAPRTADV